MSSLGRLRVGCGMVLRRAGTTASALVLAGVASHDAQAQVRPLVLEMLQNLAALEHVSEGVAVGSFERVLRGAEELEARAVKLSAADLASLGLPADRDAQFDAFLAVQKEAARGIAASAKGKDPGGVLLGVQAMYQNACLPCHATFREPARLLRPATMFMTSFLSAQREIARGLAMRDFPLLMREAREIEALTRVMAWDQVIEATFGVSDPDARKEFRGYLNRVGFEAGRLERAASDEDQRGMLESIRAMWQDGCVSCHTRFRGQPPASSAVPSAPSSLDTENRRGPSPVKD